MMVLLTAARFSVGQCQLCVACKYRELTVRSETLITVRSVCCLSVRFYANASQVKLCVMKIHRVEFLTVGKLRIQDFWDVVQCQWIFLCLEGRIIVPSSSRSVSPTCTYPTTECDITSHHITSHPSRLDFLKIKNAEEEYFLFL